MSELRHLLLIGVLAIAVRVVCLYEIQDSPLLTYPSGLAAVFAGETAERGAGLDGPLPASPVYARSIAAVLGNANAGPFPVYVCQALSSTAACLLLCLLSTTLFTPSIGLAAGLAAAVYGPSILFAAELTPTTWSTLLQLLFLLSIARPPVRKPSYRWSISALLLALALVESLPTRNLPEPSNLAEYAVNLFHLVQGRELLPDLDPYLINDQSSVITALLWDQWLAFPFGVILPLAIPGLLLFGRGSGGRTIEGRVLLIFVFACAAVSGILAPDARQRLPLALLMLPFAAFAVGDLRRADRRRGKIAVIILLLIACNVGVAAPAHLAGASHHHYWTGVAYARLGMTANALGAYRRAVELTPTHTLATRELARLYLETERPEEALAVCRNLLRSHPGTTDVLLLQGDAYAVAGRMDDAAFTYEQIRARGVSTLPLLVRLGETYRSLGRVERAVDAYVEAVAARPDSSLLRYQLAQLYYLGEHTEMAIEQYRALLLQDPRNHVLHTRLGGLLLEEVLGESLFVVTSTLTVDASRLQGAETHLQEAIRLRPDYLGARQLLALLMTRQQRYSEAIAQLEYVLETVPDDPYPHLFLGMLKERLGKETEARRHFATYSTLDRGKRLEGAAKAEVERVLDELLSNRSSGR